MKPVMLRGHCGEDRNTSYWQTYRKDWTGMQSLISYIGKWLGWAYLRSETFHHLGEITVPNHYTRLGLSSYGLISTAGSCTALFRAPTSTQSPASFKVPFSTAQPDCALEWPPSVLHWRVLSMPDQKGMLKSNARQQHQDWRTSFRQKKSVVGGIKS